MSSLYRTARRPPNYRQVLHVVRCRLRRTLYWLLHGTGPTFGAFGGKFVIRPPWALSCFRTTCTRHSAGVGLSALARRAYYGYETQAARASGAYVLED